METKKYLVLNSTQEKELIAQGSVVVYSKGFAYNVFKDENGQISITSASNVLTISQYEAIVVGKEDKYGIINTNGEEYVPIMLDTVYSITSSGEDKYYMSFTWPEENGQQVTYDVDQYFEEHVVQTPETPEIDQNLIANETTTQNTVDANTQTTPENTADSNTQTEDTSSNVAQQ